MGVHLARTDAHGVTQGEAHVLSQLAHSSPQTVGELHEGLGHKRSTLTSILDRLAERGLITRQASDADRRTFLIGLTPEGRRIARATAGELADFEQAVLAHVSDRDVAGFLKVVRKIAELGRGPK